MKEARESRSEEGLLLSDAAYERIKRGILEEALAPGSFISERKVSEMMGLGVASVRRAFQRLGDEGFLRISPRQGAMVADLLVEEILEVYELRKVIESYVVRKIAGQLGEGLRDELEKNLTQQLEAWEANDLRATIRLDMTYHDLLCAAAENREMQVVMSRLRDKVYRIIVRSVKLQPNRTEESIKEHRRILKAIESGDGEKAARCMEKHLDFGKRFVLLR